MNFRYRQDDSFIHARKIDNSPQPGAIDWKRYCFDFEQEHGDDPVVDGLSLLFKDGWSYGLTPEGPEYASSEKIEELKATKIKYWQLRKNYVINERLALSAYLSELEELQSAKSLPLNMIQTNPETKEKESLPIDFEGMEKRITWLEQDSIDCDEKLKELQT